MNLSIVFVIVFTVRIRANLLQECAKLYNPVNIVGSLPSLKLPYLGDVTIPNNIPPIKPSAVTKTKAIKVVTTYVYKNPVCVKYTKKKGICRQDNAAKHKGAYEKLVTKEYFVKDRSIKNLGTINRHRRRSAENDGDDDSNRNYNFRYENNHFGKAEDDYYDGYLNNLESSETIALSKENRKTPGLPSKRIYNMLIEDRLDQLETILPHYTRRRTYETSTITVTKVLSNQRTMATLMVKNCIPFGLELCAPKTSKRRSKVARPTSFSNVTDFFG